METAKGRNRTRNADFRRFLQIFADKSRDVGVADLRRKPQETADFCRKPQIFAETGFSHLLSPFWRAPISFFPGGFLRRTLGGLRGRFWWAIWVQIPISTCTKGEVLCIFFGAFVQKFLRSSSRQAGSAKNSSFSWDF